MGQIEIHPPEAMAPPYAPGRGADPREKIRRLSGFGLTEYSNESINPPSRLLTAGSD